MCLFIDYPTTSNGLAARPTPNGNSTPQWKQLAGNLFGALGVQSEWFAHHRKDRREVANVNRAGQIEAVPQIET